MEVQTPGSSHGPSTQRSKTWQAQEMDLHFLPFSQLEAGVERVRVTHRRSSAPQVNTLMTTGHKCLLRLSVKSWMIQMGRA